MVALTLLGIVILGIGWFEVYDTRVTKFFVGIGMSLIAVSAVILSNKILVDWWRENLTERFYWLWIDRDGNRHVHKGFGRPGELQENHTPYIFMWFGRKSAARIIVNGHEDETWSIMKIDHTGLIRLRDKTGQTITTRDWFNALRITEFSSVSHAVDSLHRHHDEAEELASLVYATELWLRDSKDLGRSKDAAAARRRLQWILGRTKIRHHHQFWPPEVRRLMRTNKCGKCSRGTRLPPRSTLPFCDYCNKVAAPYVPDGMRL